VAGRLRFTQDLDLNVGGLLKLTMEAWDWLESQSELRQSAHSCGILNFLNTVLGLGRRLDLLEELDMEADVVVGGVDSVDTHAGCVASLEEDFDVRSCS
jgi:hypothetical protein